MTQSFVVIRVYEPGARADELLAAIAAKLGVESIRADENGQALVPLAGLAWDRAYDLAEQALDEAGDEGRLVVRVGNLPDYPRSSSGG